MNWLEIHIDTTSEGIEPLSDKLIAIGMDDFSTEDEREFNATYKGGFGEPKCTYEEIRPQGENPQHVGILNNFANAILGLEPLFVDGREGLAGVTLMDSMLLSTWKDKMIDLPFDDDEYYAELQKRIAGSSRKDVQSVVLNTEGTYGSGK